MAINTEIIIANVLANARRTHEITHVMELTWDFAPAVPDDKRQHIIGAFASDIHNWVYFDLPSHEGWSIVWHRLHALDGDLCDKYFYCITNEANPVVEKITRRLLKQAFTFLLSLHSFTRREAKLEYEVHFLFQEEEKTQNRILVERTLV